MEKEQKELIKQGVDKTNKPSFLINSKRSGTLTSNKIYNHFLKIVLKEYEVGGNHNGIFYTTIPQIKNYIGGKNLSNREIWNNIKLLQNTQIEHIEDYDKKDKNWSSYQLMGSCEYTLMKDLIEFDMSPIFLKKLMELKENGNLLYAALEDRFIKNFSYKHSLVLYEYLKDYQGQIRLKKPLSFYRKLLNLEDKYPQWKSFKNYVFERSFKEILEKTNLNFTYEYEKDRINNEWYVRVDFKKSLQDSKNLFGYKDFQRTFKSICMVDKLQIPTKKGTMFINENGLVCSLESNKPIHKEDGKIFWEKLYNNNYLLNEEKIYKLLGTNKEEFEVVEYQTREQNNYKKVNNDLEEFDI